MTIKIPDIVAFDQGTKKSSVYDQSRHLPQVRCLQAALHLEGESPSTTEDFHEEIWPSELLSRAIFMQMRERYQLLTSPLIPHS